MRSGIQIACFYEAGSRLEGLVIAGRAAAPGDLWNEDASNVTSTPPPNPRPMSDTETYLCSELYHISHNNLEAVENECEI